MFAKLQNKLMLLSYLKAEKFVLPAQNISENDSSLTGITNNAYNESHSKSNAKTMECLHFQDVVCMRAVL